MNAADHAGDPVRGVVVQQPPGQRRVAAARQHDGNVRARHDGKRRCQPGRGVGQATVGAVGQLKRDPGPGVHPLAPELVRSCAIQAEVDRAQYGRPQASRVFQRRDGGQVVAVDKEQDDPAGVVRRLGSRAAVGGVGEALGLGPVLPVEPDKGEYQHREDDDDQPCEVRLVAAHSWDIAGALAAGCQAAFVARPGMVLSPLADPPGITGPDLAAVAQQIINIDG